MAANELSINQISTLINAVCEQATGRRSIEVTNTSDFVAVANTVLKTGYDPTIQAISQVLTKSIFSNRPYSRKFKSLEATNQAYGNHVRKLQMCDSEFENDKRFELVDGQSVDQYKVKKPDVIQTNIYGQNVRQYQAPTIFKDQLDTALSNPEEFAQFMSMQTTNTNDQIEKMHEECARATVANLIGGVIAGGKAESKVHLLTEYNAYLGLSGNEALTKVTIRRPENFIPFIKWVYARIETLMGLLSERSKLFHVTPDDKNLQRHTGKADINAYLFASLENDISASVLADTYHKDLLKLPGHEKVNFWQNIEEGSRDKIKVDAGYIDATGAPTHSEVEQADIVGVLFDREAAGYTTVNTWSAPTPFNANGGYTNIFYHFTDRHWNDFTENVIVLLLD